jgi:hypothetical protein
MALKAAEQMYSRAEQFRRRGIAAQQRAGQTTDQEIKEALEYIARDWFALAEQVEWLEGTRESHPSNSEL